MKSLLFAFFLAFSFSASADLKGLFQKIESKQKGPFELNYLQGTKGRTAIRDGAKSPPGTFLFQAAFRNENARAMVEQHNFYLGNLFTTNYYELMGRFVYNDAYGSFALDHAGLAAAAPQASSTVSSIAKSWVLERAYTQILPHARLSKAFQVRGISGSEFEVEYATYFFNFGLTAVSEDFQYLPLFLLAKTSPLTDAASLDKARDMITQVFESARQQYGDGAMLKDLYAVRNAIHNQVSPDVVARISSFLKKHSGLSRSLKAKLEEIQGILKAYYNVGPKQISVLAKAAGSDSVLAIAKEISDGGFNSVNGLKLSEALVEIRSALSAKTLAYDSQTKYLVLLATAAQYLNKELTSLDNPTGKEPLLAAVNLLYVEGYLIQDNWNYFKSEISAAASTEAAAAMLPDLIEIGTDTLTQAFDPALAQWISLEPKMEYFIDNTIKASSLNTAAQLAQKVK